MSDVSLTKSFLFVALFVVLFILATFWRFPMHTDSFQGAGVLVAALIPLVMLAIPLWRPVVKNSVSSINLVFDEHEREMVFWPNPFHVSLYEGLDETDYKLPIINEKDVPKGQALQYWPIFADEKAFDLVESLVLLSYIHEFQYSWASDKREYLGLGSKMVESTPVEIKGERNRGEKFQLREFSSFFPHNSAIQKSYKIYPIPYFHLPPKVSIYVPESQDEDKNYTRTIIFQIPHEGRLTIKISKKAAGIIGRVDSNRAVINYGVDVELRYFPYTENGKAISKWFEQVSDLYKKLEWSTPSYD